MRSMTGFGQAAGENERFRLSVVLRGVNHRFLDLSLRLSDDLRPAEPALRELLAGKLWRGRVELTIEVEALGARGAEIAIDERAVAALHDRCADLRARGLITGDLELRDLLRLPEVLKLELIDPEWTDADRELLLQVVARALDQLVAARSVEGVKLAAALRERLDGLETITADLETLRRGAAEDMARALRQRIAELLRDAKPDEDRLAQEVAYLVDRSDVSEELDRLQSHLEHFRTVMGQDGSIGKRLDFLTQEIFRELNTVGSKCRASDMTQRVLDGKVLCEQLREQVQNVE